MGVYRIAQDSQAWEMHPAGDELLVMLSGAIDVVLEQAGGEVVLTLGAGHACLVPRGTWHRQVVRRPGEYLGATYGRGTQQRPRCGCVPRAIAGKRQVRRWAVHAWAVLVGWFLGSASGAQECGNAPPPAAASTWTYIEACGCANLDVPPKASQDHERFLKACGQWRERNPHGSVTASGDNPVPLECKNPPSRASDSYWDYIEACGCSRLEPPSRASSDYDRFLKACGRWRERNPQVNMTVPGTLGDPAMPAAETGPTAGRSPSPKPTSAPLPMP